MFLDTPALHVDPLWRLSAECAADAREDRRNLIVGVYRDESGVCPVMPVVREAEQRIIERSLSKEYFGLSGNLEFNDLMSELILGDPQLVERATTIQTVAGTGALRLLAELLATTGSDRTVYLGTPAYVNHPAILHAARLRTVEYPMSRDGRVDIEAMLAVARTARRGDVMLIQGCCHNPTGLSLSVPEWEVLAAVMSDRGIVPFIDQAYFGLGDGLHADLAGMRNLLRVMPEAVIAVSASKAWGLYSERTGCAIVLTSAPAAGAYARNVMEVIARAAYSQPPSHGARIVAEILSDVELRARWRAELDEMRVRLTSLRDGLVGELQRLRGTDAFTSLRDQRGMFLRLPLDAEQMRRLQHEFATYGIPSGRINLAGLTSASLPGVAHAICAVAEA